MFFFKYSEVMKKNKNLGDVDEWWMETRERRSSRQGKDESILGAVEFGKIKRPVSDMKREYRRTLFDNRISKLVLRENRITLQIRSILAKYSCKLGRLQRVECHFMCQDSRNDKHIFQFFHPSQAALFLYSTAKLLTFSPSTTRTPFQLVQISQSKVVRFYICGNFSRKWFTSFPQHALSLSHALCQEFSSSFSFFVGKTFC